MTFTQELHHDLYSRSQHRQCKVYVSIGNASWAPAGNPVSEKLCDDFGAGLEADGLDGLVSRCKTCSGARRDLLRNG